jgi:DNA-binding response OmpR family regulator/drug/metabolite transporter (DMT)-like permease
VIYLGKILVVDDTMTSRRKIALAVKQLGYIPEEVSGGQQALEALAEQKFDLVLLDIMMPEVDGFEVLQRMSRSNGNLDVPVLVISGLDDDVVSVAKAIRMGADDFLPKSFEPVLFKARVEACIEKKKLRDLERDYLAQVDKLTAAAGDMEAGPFHPENLGLKDVAQRQDALGRLAGIFLEMAKQVYDRELTLQRNLRTLRGSVLLILTGLAWGLLVPLTVLIYQSVQNPIGVTVWTSFIAGVACCVWATLQGKSLKVGRTGQKFILAWALVYGASDVVLYTSAGRVSGIALSIIMALQGFAVFGLAAVLRIEAPTLRRFAGLAVGLIGVLALMIFQQSTPGSDSRVWMLIAMAVPILYGVIDILIADKLPENLDTLVATGLVLLYTSMLIFPLALLTGQAFLITSVPLDSALLIILAGFCVAVCTLVYLRLIALAGPVFGSQSAYATTVAGIGWSVLLLGEALTIWTVVAFGLVAAGLVLVGPKREASNTKVAFRWRSR